MNLDTAPPIFADVLRAFTQETEGKYVGLCQHGVDTIVGSQCSEQMQQFLHKIGIDCVNSKLFIIDRDKYLIAKLKYNF